MILQLYEGIAPEAVRARMVDLFSKIPTFGSATRRVAPTMA
ncbi:MAG: hypothetical protein WCI71_04285 [Bacteroidota bacterium]